MKKVNFSQIKPYDPPPNHFNMVGMKLHGKEETGTQKFRVGLSYYLPSGGAGYDGENSPSERVFLVLDGEIIIKNKQEEFTLGAMDSLLLEPYEGREIINKTNKPAKVLIITSL